MGCAVAVAAAARPARAAGDMAGADDPDAPTVGVSIDKTEAHVGDRLTLTVSAVAKAGIAVMLPAKLDTRQARDPRPQRRRQSRARSRRRAPLAPLRPRRRRLRDRRDRGAGARGHLSLCRRAQVRSVETEPLTRQRAAAGRGRRAAPRAAARAAAALGVGRGPARRARAQVGRHRARRRDRASDRGAAHPARVARRARRPRPRRRWPTCRGARPTPSPSRS